MRPPLGILAGSTFQSHINPTRDHFFELGSHRLLAGQVGVIEGLDVRDLALDEFQSPGAIPTIDQDDPMGSLLEAELHDHLANGTSTPHCDCISFFDPGIHDAVIGGGQDIG